MSENDFFAEFQSWLRQDCDREDGLTSLFEGWMHIVPWIVPLVFTGVALARDEIYYVLTAVVQWINTIVNYALLGVLQSSSNSSGCIKKDGWTTVSPGVAYFLSTYLAASHIMVRTPLRTYHVWFIQVWANLVWCISVAAGCNSIQQAFYSATIGSVIALLAHWAIMTIMSNYYDYVMAHPFTRWMGWKDTYYRPPVAEPLTETQWAVVAAAMDNIDPKRDAL